LHPRHKLQYFRQAGWKEEWIEAAKGITQTIYEERYATRDVEDSDEPKEDSDAEVVASSVRSHCWLSFMY
ncbi:hypothetical protein HDZ31DRAFT_49340, partial [Schizophyllum fasciatum]